MLAARDMAAYQDPHPNSATGQIEKMERHNAQLEAEKSALLEDMLDLQKENAELREENLTLRVCLGTQ